MSPKGNLKEGGKQMRKGTHSCIDCRRRKARCVFRQEISTSCLECFTRGVPCREQTQAGIVEVKKAQSKGCSRNLGIKDMASKPSEDIETTAPRTPESLDSSNNGLGRAVDLEYLSGGNHEDAPLVSMIEKSIAIQFPQVLPAKIDPPYRAGNLKIKGFRTCQTLRALIPSAHDLELILNLTSGWWSSWHCLFPTVTEIKRENSLAEFISWGAENKSPQLVALTLLCIVISIQQTKPGSFDHLLDDPIPLRELMDECMSTVEHLIIGDSMYSNCHEGIEVMFTQAQCYVNLGQPQKAWLMFHRAISVAQLLGLHRGSKHTNGSMAIQDQQVVWWTLNELERFLSLVLGLPYAVRDDSWGYQAIDHTSPLTIATYRRQLSLVAIQIMERNKACPSPSLDQTSEIDIYLNNIAASLPSEFQTPDPTSSPTETYERLMTRFWHHQLKAFIHLPFAFRSSKGLQLDISHIECFTASREMIHLYQIMRLDSKNAYHMCRVIDFQAFTAALLLLLRCLGYGGLISEAERSNDLKLIDMTADILECQSSEYGGIVAAQGAQVLTRLRSSLQHQGHDGQGLDTEKIAVPYFGTITISTNPIPAPDQLSRLPSQDFQAGRNEVEDSNIPQPMDNYDPSLNMSTDFPEIDIDWDAIVNMDLDQEWNCFQEG